MENLDLYIDVAKFAIAGIGTIASAIAGYKVQKAKKEKHNEEELRTQAELYIDIKNYAEIFCQEAEKFKQFDGYHKRTYAMTKMQEALQKKGKVFNADMALKAIESFVSMTKRVNQRPKDMETNDRSDIIQYSDNA